MKHKYPILILVFIVLIASGCKYQAYSSGKDCPEKYELSYESNRVPNTVEEAHTVLVDYLRSDDAPIWIKNSYSIENIKISDIKFTKIKLSSEEEIDAWSIGRVALDKGGYIYLVLPCL